MSEKLTICSVSYNSAPFIKLNYQLTQTLNPDADVVWIVGENSPIDSPSRLSENEAGIRCIEGAGDGHIPIYHHTLALKRCTDLAASRFILVIDPDYYAVNKHWIFRLIDHMKSNRLAIMGVPWHPKSVGKYRYFPAVHFSLFDTALFPQDDIDFRPDFPDGDNDPEWPQGWNPDHAYFATSGMTRALATLPLLRNRRQFFTDTGSRLYKKYVGARDLRFETFSPVFDPDTIQPALSPAGRLLERILPDELCYHPKAYDRGFRTSFLRHLYAKDAPAHWEEFMWNREPFGFHVRGNLDRGKRDSFQEIAYLRHILDLHAL